jgi:hypothetical protein
MKSKLLLFAVALVYLSAAQSLGQKINKSYTGIKTIEISTASGDCELMKNSSDKVDVTLTYSYDDEKFTPVFEQEGDVLILKEKFEKGSSSYGDSKWVLSIPSGLTVKYNSGSGDLSAKGLDLDFSSNAGSGDIRLENLSGSFKSNTGSGDVDITNYTGDFSINTGSGDVSVSEAKGNIGINLGSGDISADMLEGKLSFNAGSGDLDVKDVILTGSSSFNSGSGDATVVLKSALKHNISIASGSGDAKLDFNGIALAGEITMKANKKNGDISAPFNFDSETEENNGNQTILKKVAKIGNSDVQIKISTGSGTAEIEK